MNSCLYRGVVGHRRITPVPHAFRYRVFFVYLDLAELDRVFSGSWLWSTRRPAVAWFRRADHLGDPSVPLHTAVRALVEKQTGRAPEGPVRMLTHLRYFGYCMNPVSFYYLFDRSGDAVEAVVAEVHNTPWGERHCYVLSEADRPGLPPTPPGPGWQGYETAKSFHVSPFQPMGLEHTWWFTLPGDTLRVRVENRPPTTEPRRGEPVFEAWTDLVRKEITPGSLRGALLRHPFMTGKVVGGIYVEALRLWLKGAPFHAHPKTREPGEPGAGEHAPATSGRTASSAMKEESR